MDPMVEILRRQSAHALNVGETLGGPAATHPRAWRPKSTGEARFYGPGTTLKFDRGEVNYPLVYVCKGVLGDFPDASLIESGLPVARSGTATDDLPYWPSYRAATPAQRSRYIDWLIGGRCDPEIPLGYVFIYFYGLERRVLVDRVDCAVIAAEVMRLLPIYSHSRSFQRYATTLLWTSIWMSLKEIPVAGELVEAALESTKFTDETLSICLAYFASMGTKVPDSLVYRIAECDVRSPRSIVAQRHPVLHRDAFMKGLRSRFPEGFRLRSGKRERRLEYFPASATLGRLHATGGPLVDEKIPNILGVTSQFQSLVDIWTQSNEDLKSYDRAHRKAGGADLTAGMYEALPEYLRDGDHPHFDAWYEIMERSVTEDGWTVVPAGVFAALDGLSERKKLTKAQSERLAITATHMGLALEPDPRITGRGYEWDDLVSVFPATDELGQDLASYHAAAVLLELGVAVAASDGQIDEIEIGRLTSHLESQFVLSSQDAARLAHLRYVLTKQPPTEFSAAKTLQKNLTVPQRQLVGEFLVGIAAADQVIAATELKALEKAYRALGLEPIDLQNLLKSFAPSADQTDKSGVTEGEFQLDLARINSIMTETEKVTQFLRDALREDLESSESDFEEAAEFDRSPSAVPSEIVDDLEQVKPPTPAVFHSNESFPNLPQRLVIFVTALLKRDRWPRKEMGDLARAQGLMIGSAIEQINDWAYDNLTDALLLEEDDDIQVQRHLIPEG